MIGCRLANWLSQYEFFASSADLELRQGRLTHAGLQAINRWPGNGSSDIWWVDAAILQEFR